ncbi:hypothetical protein AM571_CH02829 [Rhizobium etli 8C-3]|uniref:Uncharacterized protein n=1 Tax=Rhizobium etli 8C-3 TaxID=538025 RepID=A0A1L5P660_RHIET|nr:hypothetical protein AM571_CH02829 [Rhizobium etli 8C-3]
MPDHPVGHEAAYRAQDEEVVAEHGDRPDPGKPDVIIAEKKKALRPAMNEQTASWKRLPRQTSSTSWKLFKPTL